MRKVIFGALLCVLLTVFGCGPAEWVDFESDEGKFAVLIPASPKMQRQKVNTAIGPIEVVMFMHSTSSGAYMVGFSDYPQSLIDKQPAMEMLSNGVKGAMANIRGRKKSEKNITLDGYTGKEITFTIPVSTQLPGGGKGKARMYLVGNRLFQVLALGRKAVSGADFDKFLDSFKLYEDE